MKTRLPYRDRIAAGRELADHFDAGHRWRNAVVLGLPRGGVPVAAEVATALGAELDVLVVRKIGLPWQPELAMGAIASGGICVRNESVIRATGVSDEDFDEVARAEREELKRRERRYRGERPLPVLAGRPVILVDDGLATGSTMRAAVAAVRAFDPAEVAVAVPVGSDEAVASLQRIADEVICPATPEPFGAIGAFYDDFSQVGDDEVEAILQEAYAATEPKARTDGSAEP